MIILYFAFIYFKVVDLETADKNIRLPFQIAVGFFCHIIVHRHQYRHICRGRGRCRYISIVATIRIITIRNSRAIQFNGLQR